MSQKKVLATLESLGLAKSDAQLYVLLGKKGPQKAKDIANYLKMPKQTLYLSLKTLQNKGIVLATLEHPALFSAVPFEKILDVFIKAKIEEAQRFVQEKNSILLDWRSITIDEAAEQSAKFTVLEGRNYIYPRLRQMIQETEQELLLVSSIPSLIRAEHFGLLDAALSHSLKHKIKFRFLTEFTEQSLKSVKNIIKTKSKTGFNFEGRTPELGLRITSKMLIRDDKEAVFFINPEAEETEKQTEETCLWTNCKTIVNSFRTVFEEIWKNSQDISAKILEIETGKPIPKSLVIKETVTAKKKYHEAIAATQKELAILTSAGGLNEALSIEALLRARIEKGVSVKIMAPITRDNLEIALKLSEFCAVRHVSSSYLNTTIIDRKQIFQFKNTSSDQKSFGQKSTFENTFYSNEPKYVKKASSVLDSVWENAYSPSAITISDITKPPRPVIPPVPDDEFSVSKRDHASQKNIISVIEKPKEVTEEYVLNKLINAKRVTIRDISKDTVYFYGSWATAVFHPPSSFNLPDFMIVAIHSNKQSSFGGGDSLQIHSWLETPKGHAFVPVAAVGDNPESIEWTKAYFAGTPLAQNCLPIRKDELQIQIHGNTAFAGWTKPIRLFPPKYVIPPSCILVEGYGKVKTSVITFSMPTGTTAVMESNGFDAFATFYHPTSKYAGPGTDATISRENIMTAFPPQDKLKSGEK